MSQPPVVRLENVRYRWQRGAPLVLDIPAFEVAPGERVFIKGPSGSGKTTLLNLLAGVTVPEEGRVELLGTDVGALGSAKRDSFRADHIGFIFQMFNLIPYLAPLANVALPCRFSKLRRERARTRSGTPETEARRLLAHLGLDGVADAGAAVRLSVGQQQRVAAARALIGGPELVIADEPTSALDEDVRRAFLDLLFQEADAAGATVLFVSHDGTLEEMFERTVSLQDLNRAGRSAA